ncbi:MAG: tRNA (adenosine(37)-N6)-dimethylallyltransferase MiaA [Lachnospiraceae bacterium]|nr:tRNA (adenosine(37)-N6)-dimethylallyltransferase MiaA [Lachnospiraceae bacterium]
MTQKQEKKKLIVLTGPTAVGKTELSVRLAKKLDAEIVSCDSVQVYRGMDIGSAKVTPEEMQGVPHHLIDVLDPSEDFDLYRFQAMARAAVADIHARGKIPILSGGTGFYIQSVIYDVDLTENGEDPAVRARLKEIADREGPEALHAMLREADPASAEAIHPNNVRKVIRALEFLELSGTPISEHNARERQSESPYDLSYFVLNRPRSELYGRIDRRVDLMMEAGLEEEVRGLLAAGVPRGGTAMQAIGYKEIAAYLDGSCTRDEAVGRIKTASRHYAKRQLTWFRRERNVQWIELSEHPDPDELTAYLLERIETGPIGGEACTRN